MQPRTVPAQLKQAGPGPVLYRHRKHNPAPTFIPLPERRPAIYMSIQNEQCRLLQRESQLHRLSLQCGDSCPPDPSQADRLEAVGGAVPRRPKKNPGSKLGVKPAANGVICRHRLATRRPWDWPTVNDENPCGNRGSGAVCPPVASGGTDGAQVEAAGIEPGCRDIL